MENIESKKKETSMQVNGADALSREDKNLALEKEATRGWLEMVKAAEHIEKRHHDEMSELRRQMTRSYKCLMKEIENSKEMEEAMHAEIAKKWIRDNLEEAQQQIDSIVGIKGITENPLKAAKEAGIAENQEPFYDIRDNTPLPRVSISSSTVPSNEELYGY
jgi:hypothetical protein